jgi:hypothetical protein
VGGPEDTRDWYESGGTYWCAFCNLEIEHIGFDPVRVDIDSARTPASGKPGSWLVWAHALCVRDAFHRNFAHDIPREWYMPDWHPEDEHARGDTD